MVVASPAAGAPRRSAKAEVQRVADAYHRAVARKDANAVADLYARDAWFMASTSPAIHGRDAIGAHFVEIFGKGLCAFTLTSQELHTGGSLVVSKGRYTDSVCAADGSVAGGSQGSYVLTFLRQKNGSLKILYDIFTVDTP